MNEPNSRNSNTNKSQTSNDRQNKKMHEIVTYLVMGLFILVVMFGLYTQNFWLLGSVCFPVIAYGVYKVFDRYL